MGSEMCIRDSPEPRPAATKPYTGDNIQPQSNTMQSPIFKWPFKGDGNLMIIVATQASAAKSAAVTNFFVFVSIIFTPLFLFM